MVSGRQPATLRDEMPLPGRHWPASRRATTIVWAACTTPTTAGLEPVPAIGSAVGLGLVAGGLGGLAAVGVWHNAARGGGISPTGRRVPAGAVIHW
jgi:hypothetical protein